MTITNEVIQIDTVNANIEWVDVSYFAQRMGVNMRTIRNWMRRGIVPPAREIAGRFRWPKTVVDEFAARPS